MLNIQHVVGTTIDDVHFKLVRKLFQTGNVYIIDRGSYIGQKRLEFDFVTPIAILYSFLYD